MAWGRFKSPSNLLGAGGVLVVRDEKPSGTAGGDLLTGAWRTRTLNTVPTNTISGASVATNQITLPTGTYYIVSSAPGFIVGNHKLRLRNVTASANLIVGQSNYTGTDITNPTYVCAPALLDGVFALTASSAIELQHYAGTGRAGNGAGANSSVGEVEVFAQVTIFKLS